MHSVSIIKLMYSGQTMRESHGQTDLFTISLFYTFFLLVNCSVWSVLFRLFVVECGCTPQKRKRVKKANSKVNYNHHKKNSKHSQTYFNIENNKNNSDTFTREYFNIWHTSIDFYGNFFSFSYWNSSLSLSFEIYLNKQNSYSTKPSRKFESKRMEI